MSEWRIITDRHISYPGEGVGPDGGYERVGVDFGNGRIFWCGLLNLGYSKDEGEDLRAGRELAAQIVAAQAVLERPALPPVVAPTVNERKLIESSLRLQEHRDRIRALRSQRQPCEIEHRGSGEPDDVHEPPCWASIKHPETGEDLVAEWCPACQHNRPLYQEEQVLHRRTGSLVRSCTVAARRVRAERVLDEALPEGGRLTPAQADRFVGLLTEESKFSGGVRVYGSARTLHKMAEAGLTPAEMHAFFTLAGAATEVLALPTLHPMEREEVCHAFHALQNYVLARPGVRALGWPITKGSGT